MIDDKTITISCQEYLNLEKSNEAYAIMLAHILVALEEIDKRKVYKILTELGYSLCIKSKEDEILIGEGINDFCINFVAKENNEQ